jgi:hypothetical protein
MLWEKQDAWVYFLGPPSTVIANTSLFIFYLQIYRYWTFPSYNMYALIFIHRYNPFLSSTTCMMLFSASDTLLSFPQLWEECLVGIHTDIWLNVDTPRYATFCWISKLLGTWKYSLIGYFIFLRIYKLKAVLSASPLMVFKFF